MKTDLDCLPCLLRQTVQTVRLCNSSVQLQEQAVRAVAAIIAQSDFDLSPPEIAAEVYKEIEKITGIRDPYIEKKEESNRLALSLLPSLRQEIRNKNEEEGVELAIRFAIAGNIIDYGAYRDFDFLATLDENRHAEFAVNHIPELLDAIKKLPRGGTILFLADNCGEIIFDALLVEHLFTEGFDITVAVKDGPIINDAIVADAYVAGLDKYARIISNGTRCPGTVLSLASEDFLQHYRTADMIIAKGQGNFEGLSEEERDIFFLLSVKCAAAAKHMQQITGYEKEVLQGAGEMAVYYSPAQI